MIKNKKQRQNEINTSKLVTPRQTQLSLVTMIRRGLASGCLASLLNAVKRQSCTPSHLENKCREKKKKILGSRRTYITREVEVGILRTYGFFFCRTPAFIFLSFSVFHFPQPSCQAYPLSLQLKTEMRIAQSLLKATKEEKQGEILTISFISPKLN